MIELLITLVAIGVIVYLIGLIPMDGNIKKVIQVVAVIVAVLIVLRAFGLNVPLRLP